ncbi:hypothetical protein HHI36_017703 [Cryptolaemus montrouzieri]|uniref:Uncharacterized protein n=1 Tax=Cryptolaemus montrouzieri TaxID=559131 RepID=A0ABD2NNA7_9CUCU
MRGAECGSDHHLLVAKIYLPYAATPERKIHQDEQDVHRQQLKSWNIDSSQNDSTRRKSHSNAKTHNPPWWIENLEEQIQEKKIAYHRWLSTITQDNRKNYQKERRDTAEAIKRSQNEYWDKTCEEMNNSVGNTRANKAWKIVKGLRKNNSDSGNISLIGMNDWVKHYNGLPTEDRPQFQQEQNFRSTEKTQEIENISSMEVKEAVKQR